MSQETGRSCRALPLGRQRPQEVLSLPDTFEAVSCLAPTRAHPPHTTTPCHYISYGPSPRPCGPPHRRLGWGGPSKCSGTGRLGGRGGPLWVPGLTTHAACTPTPNVSGTEQDVLGHDSLFLQERLNGLLSLLRRHHKAFLISTATDLSQEGFAHHALYDNP